MKYFCIADLFEKPEDTAEIALSVPDSDGVFFIPAFSGLGVSIIRLFFLLPFLNYQNKIG